VDCLDKTTLKETLFIGGVNNPNQMKNHSRLQEAYELGKRLGK
jgi:hypothetical protein